MPSPKSSIDDLLGESWVDLSGGSSGSISHQTNVEDYLRLLREAQRESNQSSARATPAESQRDSPRSSPKSPPNSPVRGTPMNLEWQSYYINSEPKEDGDYENFSSRPDQLPPKNWCFRPQQRDLLSIRYAKVGNTSVFSRRGLCTLFLTNILSLIIGTGVGLWLSKNGFFLPSIKIR